MKNIIALALVAILAISCGKQETDKQKQLDAMKAEYADLGKKIEDLEKELSTKTSTADVAVPVKIQALAATTFKRPVEMQGVVESDKNVIVGSEVAGRVVDVLVKEGQKVSEGQLIARVNGDITANSIQEVENALKLAEITYKKQKALRDQNVGTEMQLLQAENQRDALKKQLETLRSQYAKYNITSPVSGVVDDVMINNGENIMPGMLVARVVNNNQLKVTAQISERYVSAVQIGDSVYLKFPGINYTMGAKIGAVGQVIDPANRTFAITVNIFNNSQNLKPNLLSMVTFFDYVKPNAIAVASNVIGTDGAGSYVYVVEEKGGKAYAKRRAIKAGQTANALTEITEGLVAGDRVVTENTKGLTDGTLISIVK